MLIVLNIYALIICITSGAVSFLVSWGLGWVKMGNGNRPEHDDPRPLILFFVVLLVQDSILRFRKLNTMNLPDPKIIRRAGEEPVKAEPVTKALNILLSRSYGGCVMLIPIWVWGLLFTILYLLESLKIFKL